MKQLHLEGVVLLDCEWCIMVLFITYYLTDGTVMWVGLYTSVRICNKPCCLVMSSLPHPANSKHYKIQWNIHYIFHKDHFNQYINYKADCRDNVIGWAVNWKSKMNSCYNSFTPGDGDITSSLKICATSKLYGQIFPNVNIAFPMFHLDVYLNDIAYVTISALD